MKITKKMFREYLNSLDEIGKRIGGEEYNNWKYKSFHQTKRLYGDYLYSQDREKFNYNFKEWKKEIEKINNVSVTISPMMDDNGEDSRFYN